MTSHSTTLLTKRSISIAIAAILCLFATGLRGQNTVYLNAFKPVRSHAYTTARNMLYSTMYLGGVPYKNGFKLATTYGPKVMGYTEFSLKGKYKSINFILGCAQAEAVGLDKGIFVIKADGKKIFDKLVSSFGVPERVSLDISEVDILRFELISDDVIVGIAEPTLWSASQKSRETGKLTLAQAKPTMLVRDLRPYKQSSGHKCVSQDDKYRDARNLKINSKAYTSGLQFNANMALIGNAEAYTFFNTGGKYSTLRFTAGPLDSDGGTLGRGWLTVKADDKTIYEGEIKEGDLAKEVTLNIKGCKSLGFYTEQASGSLSIGAADIMLYPEGAAIPSAAAEESEVASAELKALPDVCKLVSNIAPYAVGGGISRENMVYDGKSDYITFSMGGVKFNEGLILQSTTHILDNNTRSHAIFNVGKEFDYISFTTGWVGKCGVLKNDTLRIYADNEIVFNQPLIATSPNQHYVVPIKKCSRLMFEKRGIVSLNHPAFGVADIVLYRGEPVANDLFVHPKPEFPDEIDLIDLGKPYIHYVSVYKDHQNELIKDGSSKKDYFQMQDGSRIYKCFILKTSVHFDLEMGPTGEPSAGVVAGMMGSSILVGAVGGATITAISPFGALIALAAGGTAHESSCAAFNIWREYDYITFTVACRQKETTDNISFKDSPIDKLLIGADGNVVKVIDVYDTMKPTTYTVPINKAEQLMFWLQCGNWNSGQYIFYDLKLSKGNSVKISVPKAGEADNLAAVNAPVEPYILPISTGEREQIDWSAPKYCGNDYVDDYFKNCKKAFSSIENFFKSVSNDYMTRASFVSSADGTTYRAITITNSIGENYSIRSLIEKNQGIIKTIDDAQGMFTTLGLSKVNANLGLVSLGLDGFKYRKFIKEASKVTDTYKQQLQTLKKNKQAEIELLNSLTASGVTVDGIASDDNRVFVR